MAVVMAFVIGGLFAAGIYMMLRRSVVKLLIGLALLTQSVNLLIFDAAQLVRARIPIVPEGEHSLLPPYADPLPQAFILTAIVISFGVTSFAVALAYRALRTTGTDDLDRIGETELS